MDSSLLAISNMSDVHPFRPCKAVIIRKRGEVCSPGIQFEASIGYIVLHIQVT
jgi:hypothetical protein